VTRFVLDAAVAVGWFVDNPVPEFSESVRKRLIRGDRAVVPALWHLEIANGLIVAERRGKLNNAECLQAVEKIGLLLGTVIGSSGNSAPVRRIFEPARAFRLSAYDAVYLDAARSEQLPLASLDRQLLKAAVDAGVEILS
jgi:predicted nucleic acid-binding protein